MSQIILSVNPSADTNSAYITWTPVDLKIYNPQAKQGVVQLSSRSIAGSASRVVFLNERDPYPNDTIIVEFNGEVEQTIKMAGKFQPTLPHKGASADSRDIIVEARWVSEFDTVVGSLEVMIRVRKNANNLSLKARQDFTTALAKLNGIKVDSSDISEPGKGIYVKDFVETHVSASYKNQHGDAHFLPWHRLYLLDLERLLQQVNPLVSLPYWKFDEPAPNVFHEDFMGQTNQLPERARRTSGTASRFVRFGFNNHLIKWQIDNVNGILRESFFDTINGSARGYRESVTLSLGGGNVNPEEALFGERQSSFSAMEFDPHGSAHVSFNGVINSVPVATKDPLFFLLHSNVDRLWARWQNEYKRYDVNDKRSYPYQSFGDTRDAWKLVDADQWPWDGNPSADGLTPPGSRRYNFTATTAGENFPGNVPKIKDTIDPFGNRGSNNNLGFGYDDVGYEYEGVDQIEFKSIATSMAEDNEALGFNAESQERISIANSEEKIDALIALINDEKASPDEKMDALDTLEFVSIFSPIMPAKMPEFVNALRGLISDDNLDLRKKALSDLAVMKDEVAQDVLLKSIAPNTPEADKVIATHEAVTLLGHDDKVLTTKLLKEIAANAKDKETLAEVVRHILADEDSLELLQSVMEDDANPIEVRAMIPDMINNLNPKAFIQSAKTVLNKEGDHDMTLHLARGIEGIDSNNGLQLKSTEAPLETLVKKSPKDLKTEVLKRLNTKASTLE